MKCWDEPNAAMRLHRRRFAVWMTIYVVVIIAVSFGLSGGEPRFDALHVAAGAVSLVPVFFALRESYFTIQAMDELQRRIHEQGLLIALLCTIAVVLGAGFLQIFAAVPNFMIFWLWPVIAVGYGIGIHVGRRRYR